MREPLKVLFTVDVEVWPRRWNLDPGAFQDAFRRYIHGPTPSGEFGAGYQARALREHGLKGVFLVESLFACQFGIGMLREIVDLIAGEGQEVQMHLHPEWIGRMTDSILPGRKARRMRDYGVDEQTTMVRHGLENLRAAGADRVTGFRAGGYTANRDTLTALSRNGLRYDTSYNPCVLGDTSGIAPGGVLLQPRQIDGVLELPIAVFEDWPGHLRPAQLGACSFAELSAMLARAHREGWRYFVIVSHGFELLNPAKSRVDPIVLSRFKRLLRLLDRRRDRYRTIGFGDLGPGAGGVAADVPALASHPLRTAFRYGSQAARRVFE